VCGVRDDEERRLLKQYYLVRLCVLARDEWCQDSGQAMRRESTAVRRRWQSTISGREKGGREGEVPCSAYRTYSTAPPTAREKESGQ
jgi:hypothetical protein